MDKEDRILHPTHGSAATLATNASPSQGDISATQPQGDRAPAWEGVPVQFHLRAAELLDLSLSGAIVEHTEGVRVGEVYRLCFPVQGIQVEFLGRAIHSSVSRVVAAAEGESEIVYRTGLEFVGLKESDAQILSAYIDELRQQKAGQRMANPMAEAPESKTRPLKSVTPNTKVPTRPSARGNAIAANRPVSIRRNWWLWSPRELTALVMLGCALVFSLYLPEIYRWIQVRTTVASVPDAGAPKGGPRGDQLPPALAATSALEQSVLTAGGLISLPQGPVPADPIDPIVARILGPSIGSIQAGGVVDLSPLLPIVSPIFGVSVAAPPRLPAPAPSKSQPVSRDSAVRPATPQPPAETSAPQEETVEADLSLPPSGATPIAALSAPVPQPRSIRPKADSLPVSEETATPSERAQPPAEPSVPQEGVASRTVANMRGVDLREADLRGADLQGADLTGARLAWARLTGAKLQGATLRGADLTETDLWLADLRGADLQGADLTGARLAWARLTGAKLQGATLRGADLTETDLWLADLRGADLRKVDLTVAKFTQAGQAASGEEPTVEAVAMTPTPGAARPEASTEILDPRREAMGPTPGAARPEASTEILDPRREAMGPRRKKDSR
jgi:hypothetical protein